VVTVVFGSPSPPAEISGTARRGVSGHARNDVTRVPGLEWANALHFCRSDQSAKIERVNEKCGTQTFKESP
jgi:hypothetical protein